MQVHIRHKKPDYVPTSYKEKIVLWDKPDDIGCFYFRMAAEYLHQNMTVEEKKTYSFLLTRDSQYQESLLELSTMLKNAHTHYFEHRVLPLTEAKVFDRVVRDALLGLGVVR